MGRVAQWRRHASFVPMGNRTEKQWSVEVSELLARAAEARPGIREEMAERALNEQIEALRRTGRIARA